MSVILLLIAALRATTNAQPAAPADQAMTAPAAPAPAPAPALPAFQPPVTTAPPQPTADSPWLDLSLSPFHAIETQEEREEAGQHKVAAAVTLGGIYAGFTTWTYFAWYRKHKPLEQFRFGCFFCNGKDGNVEIWSSDGWFGARRYAGGADKLGHAWATMGLARGGTELLAQWGGFDRLTSALVSTALAETLFFGVEIKDGFYYEFSFGDLTFNTLGAALGFAMSMSPRLDELLDFRVEYWPSDAYRAQFTEGNTGKNLNIAEDYSGETYLLALHLGGIRSLRESQYGGWSRFVDLAVGFGTRGYKPEPPTGAEKYKERQHMYFGIALNAQGVLDYLLEGRSRPARKISHGLFEVFSLPFGSLPLIEHTQRPSSPADGGGA